jgi:hypothetical protein
MIKLVSRHLIGRDLRSTPRELIKVSRMSEDSEVFVPSLKQTGIVYQLTRRSRGPQSMPMPVRTIQKKQ